MHPAFQQYETATPELIQFLSNTVLGTHGAKYQHLDTQERVEQLENPLHLSLIRNEKILGNITFSRRGKNWYVRYFAFDTFFQRTKTKDSRKTKRSFLKEELRHFFQAKIDSGEVSAFYAYIDPKNDKSHLLATELGFNKSGELSTQTFSRLQTKISSRFELIDDSEVQNNLIQNHFSEKTFYHIQNNPGKMYCIRNKQLEIIAFGCALPLRWKIYRFPGQLGGITVKLLPYIPFLNQIIQPRNHTFIGIDKVWVKEDKSELLEELFSGILATEKKKTIVWWTASNAKYTKSGLKWGLLHTLLGVSPVHIYQISNNTIDNSSDHFSVSTDFS